MNDTLKLPPMPARIARLRRNDRGYPVPFFVAWIDGKPDFRMVEPGTIHRCVKENLCWICGEKMGAQSTFVIGPMCAVNRNNAEPPAHRDCAEFSVQACPGIMIKRNPGVIALWSTKKWRTERDGNGVLFKFDDPNHVSWWREGRKATAAEVNESINSSIPLLLEYAESDTAFFQAVWRCRALVQATT